MKNEDFKAMVNDAIEKTIAQGQQSKRGAGIACAYDGGNGLRCVVGHMMNDEEFKRFGASERAVLDIHGFKPDLTSGQMNVLDVLQDCHDNSGGNFVAEFKSHLVSNKITEMMEAL